MQTIKEFKNPFAGRNPEEIWKEVISKAVPTDKKKATEIMKKIVADRNNKK